MALPLLLFALFSGQDAVSTAPAAATPPATQAEYTPEGAPKDDYNFTAWCHGVLSGHMALAERVQPVLPLDEVQQKIGKVYLKGYEEALAVGRRNRSAAEIDAADAVRAAARANWTTAMKADLQLGADTYLAWQLPGRCEHAAKRVAGRDDLFRMAPGLDELESAGARETGIAEAPAAAPVMAPVAAAEPAATMEAPAEVELDTAEYALPDTTIDLTAAAAPEETAPAEVEVAEAAPQPATVPAAQEPAPAAEEAKTDDGRIVRMPRKGRLFPWGKRE